MHLNEWDSFQHCPTHIYILLDVVSKLIDVVTNLPKRHPPHYIGLRTLTVILIYSSKGGCIAYIA